MLIWNPVMWVAKAILLRVLRVGENLRRPPGEIGAEDMQKLVFLGSDLARAGNVTGAQKHAARIAFATHITGFQINMANILMAMIYGGVLERFPRLRVVLGEAGIGWIPYILWRWTGNGRTSSRISRSRCRRASTGSARCGRPTRPIRWA